MKGKKILALALASALALTLFSGCGGGGGGGAVANEDGVITLRLAGTMPATHQLSLSSQKFADLVNERSEGTINVEFYPAGQLFNDETMITAIPQGGVEMGVCQTANWAGLVPEAEWFTLSSYWDDYDWFKRCCYGEPGEYVMDLIEEKCGVKILTLFNYGVCELVTTMPIEGPESFQGTKMRMLGTSEALYLESLGGAPVSISASENYEGLQKGTIDGASTGPSSVLSRRLYEVAPYVTLGTYLKETKYFLMMNGNVWNSLTEDQQTLLQECADEALEYNLEACVQEDADDIAELEAMEGVTVTTLSDEAFDEIQAIVQPVVLEDFKSTIDEETYNYLMDTSEALRDAE